MIGPEFEATDPHDKVYSVLGISEVPIEMPSQTSSEDSTTQKPTMRVDYSASVSEVYQYFAKYIINRDLDLDILCILSTHRDENSADLPTWAPDWRVPTNSIGLKENWHFFGWKYAASGFTKAIPQDQSELGRLNVEGFPIDQITHLYNQTTSPPHLPEDISFSIRAAKADDLSVLAATVIGREICLVPRDSQPLDLVFILYGAKVPFVVRLKENQQILENPDEERGALRDGLEYEVVGPCWIPEMMWGQGIKDMEEGSRVLELASRCESMH